MSPRQQIQTILEDIQGAKTRQSPYSIDISDIPQENLKWENHDVKDYTSQRNLIWGMIEKYTGDPRLIEIAARIIRELDIAEREPAELIRGFQKFVQENIKFFREKPERFVSPVRTVQWGIGDCDDKTILLATLLRSFRLPVRLKFIRFISPKTGKRVSHVYPQVNVDNKWITLETVQKWPAGKDGETILKDRGIPVKVEYHGDKA